MARPALSTINRLKKQRIHNNIRSVSVSSWVPFSGCPEIGPARPGPGLHENRWYRFRPAHNEQNPKRQKPPPRYERGDVEVRGRIAARQNSCQQNSCIKGSSPGHWKRGVGVGSYLTTSLRWGIEAKNPPPLLRRHKKPPQPIAMVLLYDPGSS